MSLWDKIKAFFAPKPTLVEQVQEIVEIDSEARRKEQIEAVIQEELKKRKARKKKNVSTN